MNDDTTPWPAPEDPTGRPADGTGRPPTATDPRPGGSAPPPHRAEERSTRRRLGRQTATLALVAVLAGGSGAGVATVLDDDPTTPTGRPSTASAEVRNVALAGEVLDVAGVVDAVGPAVVSIQTQIGSGGPFGGDGGGAGTGVIISADGEILTNAHVVDGADEINVTLAGESQSRRATLVGAAPADDLALLRIDDVGDLPVAALGSSDALAVGDDVVAIGNALALRGGPSVTRGIVSSLDRTLPTPGGSLTGLVQTDAAISSGNSGGPLVNAAGEVVGINTAVAAGGMGTSAENIGFAIAIDRARPVVERLRSGTDPAEPGFLGISIADPTDGSRGGTVTSVAPGSPAEEGDVREGDLVTAVGGTPVDGAAALAAAVGSHRPGDEVTVDIVRDGDERSLEITLAGRPAA